VKIDPTQLQLNPATHQDHHGAIPVGQGLLCAQAIDHQDFRQIGCYARCDHQFMDTKPKSIFSTYPANAFLIIHGRIFPLDKNEISIGRSLDNQLVINDLGISRTHAKLVARSGHFSIRDQNSTSGTFVNGQRVRKKVLNSGDIISLAGIPMLYVEDSPGLAGTSWEATKPLD
jgi:hypothetical protein